MTACDSEDEMTFDEEFKSSIEEEPVSLTVENGLFLDFNTSGLTYYGIDANIDRYETPFEQLETYQDYTVEFDEDNDIFSITTDDGVYELEMLGPRVFWDEVNSLNLTSTRELLPE